LFGLIDEHASPNRLFVMLNKEIKNSNMDAMMIPMNIREDDFYFTLSNMKKSHVNGAYIASEYQEAAVELLDEADEFVQVYKKCDFVLREGERLIGTYLERNGMLEGEALAQEIFKNYIQERK
jgi:shikimate 5-dehydrogenase